MARKEKGATNKDAARRGLPRQIADRVFDIRRRGAVIDSRRARFRGKIMRGIRQRLFRNSHRASGLYGGGEGRKKFFRVLSGEHAENKIERFCGIFRAPV